MLNTKKRLMEADMLRVKTLLDEQRKDNLPEISTILWRVAEAVESYPQPVRAEQFVQIEGQLGECAMHYLDQAGK